MIRDLGIVRPGTTIYLPFHTFDSNDPSASVTLTGLLASDVEVYKDASMTQRASDNGYTLLDTDGIDLDGIAGIHGISIDLADNSTAGFYSAGSQYWVVIASVTVDAATVNFILATFRIGQPAAVLNTTIATLASQTSFTLTTGPAEDDALNGCIVMIHDVASAVQCGFGVVLDYTGSTKTVTLLAGVTFTAAATDNISFFPPANAAYGGGVAYTATRGLAGTALPAAAADAAGGLIISDAGGLDADAQLVTKINAILVDTETTLQGELDGIQAVVGALNDAAADGAVTTTDTVVSYLKQLINTLEGGPGIPAFPAAAVAGNGVSLAEVIRSIDSRLPAALVDSRIDANVSRVDGLALDTHSDGLFPVDLREVNGATTGVGGLVTLGTEYGAGTLAVNVSGTVATVATVTNGVTLANDAITAAKFDETTAFPLVAADTGATQVARTGADADTLETLSDQLDGVGGSSIEIASGTIGATGNDTTHLHLTGLAFADDGLNDLLVRLTDVSTGLKYSRWISDFANTGDLATLSAALPVTPEASVDTYVIFAIRQDVTGGSGLDAAGVRAAVGLASANLDTQLADLPTVAEFEARTLVAASYFDPAADAVANVTTVNGLAANVITAAATAADFGTEVGTAVWATTTRQLTGTQTFNLTGNITGNLSGSVGSVTGAVGSVTATVSANVIEVSGTGITTFAGDNFELFFGNDGNPATLLVSQVSTSAELAKVPKSDSTVTWNATALASIQTEANDAIVANRLDELLAADSDIDGAQPPTVGSVFHELLTKTAGSFTYDQTTDSLEAIRDRGDAAWITATSVTVSAITGLTIANVENMATRFLGMIELDGAVYRYTTNALEQGPSGGGAAAAVWAVEFEGVPASSLLAWAAAQAAGDHNYTAVGDGTWTVTVGAAGVGGAARIVGTKNPFTGDRVITAVTEP